MAGTRTKSELAYIFIIFLVFLLSFRSYAGHLDPNLNSDMAVHVLMAYDLKLPEDLYYWGQDRIGSIVPILGHVLLKLFPLSPIEAVSYVQYFFLAIGFFCFSSLFKNTKSKAIFALIYFLPLEPFQGLLKIGYAFAPPLTFFGIAFAIVERLEKVKFSGVTKQLLISILVVNLILALWASDFSAITIFLLALMTAGYLYRYLRQPSEKSKNTLVLITVINVLFFYFIGILFIAYAKAHASFHLDSYLKFNTVWQDFEVISKLFKQFLSTFKIERNFFLSLHSLLLIIFVMCITFLIKKDNVQQNQEINKYFASRWSLFFGLNAFIGGIAIISSKWVYINSDFLNIDNDASLRYYVPLYVFFWLAVIIKTEELNRSISRKIYVLLIGLAITSSLSLPSYVYNFEKPKSKIQQLEAIQSLGKSSFIGDYWTSYLIYATNPKLLTATPHDKHYVRCLRCVARVLALETIYLVKEGWLNSFPNQVAQFGWRLKKVGEAKILGGYSMAPYKKDFLSISSKEVLFFPIGEASFVDLVSCGYIGKITQMSDSNQILSPEEQLNGYLLWGPYVSLPQGSYRVSIKVFLPSKNTLRKHFLLADVNQIDEQSSHQVVAEQNFLLDASAIEHTFVLNFDAIAGMKYEFRIAGEPGISISSPLVKRIK